MNMFCKITLTVCLLGAIVSDAAFSQPVLSYKGNTGRLYAEFCSVCHGENGDGKSRAAGNLVPKPRDFTTPQSAVELKQDRLIQSIREGRTGTAMAAWKHQLSDPQIAALADFIRDRFMVPTAYDASNEGRRVYAEYCSVCHGDRGNGVSRASRSMSPPPRNFTSAASKKDLTRNRMVFSISFGRSNTAMAPWNTQLSKKQIEAVVEYIRTTFMKIEPGQHTMSKDKGALDDHDKDHGAGGHQHSFPTDGLAAFFAQPYAKGLSGNHETGQGLYKANCEPCHGVKGDGNGPRAFFILPRPRDFNHPAARASLNRPHLFEAIAKGKLGSEMPAWDKVMSPQQIADVSEYVLRAFIRPPAASSHGKAGHKHGKDQQH